MIASQWEHNVVVSAPFAVILSVVLAILVLIELLSIAYCVWLKRDCLVVGLVKSCILLQECKELTPFDFNDDSPSGLQVSRVLSVLNTRCYHHTSRIFCSVCFCI